MDPICTPFSTVVLKRTEVRDVLGAKFVEVVASLLDLLVGEVEAARRALAVRHLHLAEEAATVAAEAKAAVVLAEAEGAVLADVLKTKTSCRKSI